MLEVRMTNHPLSYDLVDQTGPIGSLFYAEPDEDDPTEGWMAIVNRVRFDGLWMSEMMPTITEAMAAAHEMYDNLIKERRELARFYRTSRPRIVSIPMGGQPQQWQRRPSAGPKRSLL